MYGVVPGSIPSLAFSFSSYSFTARRLDSKQQTRLSVPSALLIPLSRVPSLRSLHTLFHLTVHSAQNTPPLQVLHRLSKITVYLVKIVFIYHVLYGSLLVHWHRVVNKGCHLSPSTFVALPVFTHKSHSAFAPSSRFVFGIHCPCVRSSILPLLKYPSPPPPTHLPDLDPLISSLSASAHDLQSTSPLI